MQVAGFGLLKHDAFVRAGRDVDDGRWRRRLALAPNQVDEPDKPSAPGHAEQVDEDD